MVDTHEEEHLNTLLVGHKELAHGPDWLRALRQTAADIFQGTDLPTPAWEKWKYTNLRALKNTLWRNQTQSVMMDVNEIPKTLLSEDVYRVVFVNGQYKKSLSDHIPNLHCVSLKEAMVNSPDLYQEYIVQVGELAEKPLMALNTAFIDDGFILHALEGQKMDKPIEVQFYNNGKDQEAMICHPRSLIIMEKGAEAILVERHVGQGAYFANHVMHVALKDRASLKHYRLQDESTDAFNIEHLTVQISEKSYYEMFSCVTGASLSRLDIHGELIGRENLCNINGIYVVEGDQHTDHTVEVDHFEPNCKSVQNFRGVIDDQARAVFQGKIQVHRHAQKSDGRQLNHALLLSEKAEVNAKPELEIYADDVKCSHGATTGQLDDQVLFYLRSRGIPLKQAKALLVKSFVNQAIDEISYEPLRSVIAQHIENSLEKAHE